MVIYFGGNCSVEIPEVFRKYHSISSLYWIETINKRKLARPVVRDTISGN
jgi:hypothetical protein